eukprot:scaffold32788_cov40-Cyclotella_meneghiniana.AAC.1
MVPLEEAIRSDAGSVCIVLAACWMLAAGCSTSSCLRGKSIFEPTHCPVQPPLYTAAEISVDSKGAYRRLKFRWTARVRTE